jgi:hypothetical protein
MNIKGRKPESCLVLLAAGCFLAAVGAAEKANQTVAR